MSLTLAGKGIFQVLLGLRSLQSLWVEFLKLVSFHVTYRALCRCLCSFLNVTTNGTDKLLFHNAFV